MTPKPPPGNQSLFALRRFARPRPPEERCELCGTALAAEHEHLIEPSSRQLFCCCPPCAILFSAREALRFRRVSRDVEALPDFRLSDAQWEGLHLPIRLAFFSSSTPAGRVLAFYPSPAGATESLLPLEAWREIEAENPVLNTLEPDVEALLANRMSVVPEYFRAPIDECYKLVGLLRAHWRGLSGGPEVWGEIERFFARLRARAGLDGGPANA